MKTMAVQLFSSFVICVAAFGLHGFLVDAAHSSAATFDVMEYDAVGDGKHDDTQAFQRAWEAACADVGKLSTLQIPKGKTFRLSPLKFQGPCKSSNINVKVLGTLVAPSQIDAWEGCDANSWLSFLSIDGLVVDGSGTIDGQGAPWWGKDSSGGFHTNGKSSNGNRPSALKFQNCNGLQLSGLRHVNSPKGHIIIHKCDGASISGLHILAPENSPNTDGIDLSFSTGVTISNSTIQTGDDCISINNSSFNVVVSGVSCGPGHGISVGSLGKDGSYAAVEKISVKNCNFNGTQNGVRIKTWPGGSGYARKINFEDITLTKVKNPVIIDQFYCDGEFHCGDKPSAVQVSNVTFKGVTGSTNGKKPIQLGCSKNKACTNIVMQDVNITSAVPGAEMSVICENVHGEYSSTAPAVSCLSKLH